MPRKAVIAGASGLIGKALVGRLIRDGYHVVELVRGKRPEHGDYDTHDYSTWDGKTLGPWYEALEGADVLINLSGAPIAQRWDAKGKDQILTSRTNAARVLHEAIKKVKTPPLVWINASAVGYFGNSGEVEVDEDSPAGHDFMAKVCVAWEEALFEGDLRGTRRVSIRIGVVLSRDGGFLPMLGRLTKWFLGGHQGSGQQWISWVHIEDLVGMFLFAIDKQFEGPMVATAPNPTRNKDLMAALRAELGRPWSPPVPVVGLKVAEAIIGVPAELSLSSTRALPHLALGEGYQFKFSDLKVALNDLL